MGALTHAALLFAYAVIAAAIAFGLPDAAPTLGPPISYLFAAVAFIAAALAHEVIARRLAHAELVDSVQTARRLSLEVMEELDAARDDFAQVRSSGGSEVSAEELELLRSLLKDITPKAAARRRANGGGEDEPAPRPAKPVEKAKPRKVLTLASDAEILDITRDALADNRIDLYLQPVVRLPQRKVRYYEAFSRIRNEDGDMILPEQYISLAAQSGLISTIDNLLLLRCVQLVRAKRGPGDLGFFCNISSDSLNDEDFFPQFIEFLQHNRRKLSEKLVFEFRESDLGDVRAESHFADLAELGFSLSLDRVTKLDADFEDLAQRNFRFIKIGAEILLSEIEHDGMTIRAAYLARELKSVGIEVVAEKVEEEKTLIDLLEYELGYAQGYLFGEPRPSEETV